MPYHPLVLSSLSNKKNTTFSISKSLVFMTTHYSLIIIFYGKVSWQKKCIHLLLVSKYSNTFLHKNTNILQICCVSIECKQTADWTLELKELGRWRQKKSYLNLQNSLGVSFSDECSCFLAIFITFKARTFTPGLSRQPF